MDNKYFSRCGKRLEDNRMKIRQTRNGQFSVTVPKKLAIAAGFHKGTIVEFEWVGNYNFKEGCMFISLAKLS